MKIRKISFLEFHLASLNFLNAIVFLTPNYRQLDFFHFIVGYFIYLLFVNFVYKFLIGQYVLKLKNGDEK
jgi:hypothetical protein